ncbi:MAG: hypothetical protein ACJ79K_02100 [Gemmatimonadaceae bacterium]
MSLIPLLDRSAASDALKQAIRAIASQPWGNAPSCEHIAFRRGLPAVKVERLLTQLLHELPDEKIERVEIDARSGCSDFGGQLGVHTADGLRVFEFVWDCRWRAAEEGWTDHWGEPDQIRAAREFGWRCFAVWTERSTVNHTTLLHR